jgi:anti-sigma factor ChrR (cupin superfamily)
VARRAVAAHAAAPRLPSAAAAAPRRIALPFPGDAATAAFAAGSMRSARSPLGLRMMSASVADVEAQIKEQGDLVRAMKEAIKADESAHSKEELTAAIDKLKALKAQLEAPAAEEPAKSTVSATAPASSEPDTLADSLALAEGRYKVKTLQGADSSLVGKVIPSLKQNPF